MTKLKQPLLSLGSQGSIADSITTQKLGSATMARAKPTPSYRRNLYQAYQRWLYQDYIAQWLALSAAQKNSYRAAASRTHNTPIGAFMSESLTDLSGILAWQKLDTLSAGVTPDASRNLNHATVIGAVPITGQIGNALRFDGIDDYTAAPYIPAYNVTDKLTFQFWTIPHTQNPAGPDLKIIAARRNIFQLAISRTNGRVYAHVIYPGPISRLIISPNPLPSTFTLVTLRFKHDERQQLYFGPDLQVDRAAEGHLDTNTNSLLLAARLGQARNYAGILDNFTFYHRYLPTSDIARHSARRYPS